MGDGRRSANVAIRCRRQGSIGETIHDPVHPIEIEPHPRARRAVQEGIPQSPDTSLTAFSYRANGSFCEPHEGRAPCDRTSRVSRLIRVLGIERPKEDHEAQSREHQDPEAFGHCDAGIGVRNRQDRAEAR